MSTPARLDYLRQKYQLKVGGYMTDRQNSCVFVNTSLTQQQKDFYDQCAPPIQKDIAYFTDKMKMSVIVYKVRIPDRKGNLFLLGCLITTGDSKLVLKVFMNGFNTRNKYEKETNDICEFLVNESARIRAEIADLDSAVKPAQAEALCEGGSAPTG